MATTRDDRNTTATVAATSPDASVQLARSWNVPNLITVTRLLLAFVLFGMIYADDLYIPAALLFVFAVSTDAIDGYIARRYGLITTLGRIMDPFVDKIIVCGTFVFLLQQAAGSGINAWMVIIVIGREMLVTSLRGFLEQMGHDFSASASGKLKMLLQSVALTASLLSLSPTLRDLGGLPLLQVRDVLLWTAIVVTVYSGYVYVIRAIVLLRSASSS